MLEFSYNAVIHSATGFSPFEISSGREVRVPIAFTQKVQTEEWDVGEFLLMWKDCMLAAKVNLQKSKAQMIARANKGREHIEFHPWDLVLVSAACWPLPHQLTPKFNHRFYGPFAVMQQVNNVSYKLKLPESSKIHDVFHVSLLKRFQPDVKWGQEATTNVAYEPEAIQKK